jgi:hypothetical protein
MNKNKIMHAMPTVLFVTGIVGIFVSEGFAIAGTLKAEKILREEKTVLKPGEDPEKVPIVKHMNENGYEESQIIAVCDTNADYVKEIVKTTWKCYVPAFITTGITISALIASRRLTQKQILALSTAVASAGGLVTKYRDEIRERLGDEPLHEIDRKIASEEIAKAKPPVITTTGLLSCEEMDLSEDGEYEFFDPFTKIKFQSTKLAVLGAKYYLNRNFQLGGAAPLAMFYNFLGLDLPEEYEHAGWDVSQMAEDGYYWIDIDIVRSTEPDPETGKLYYILEYDFLPGDCDDNYYPFGNPLSQEGSFIK